MRLNRLRTVLLVLGLAVLLAGVALYVRLAHDVSRALTEPPADATLLAFVALAAHATAVERWGGGTVEAIALASGSLLTAGGFGVADERGDLSSDLPTLHASALVLWRGRPVVALAAGGLYRRTEDQWEEARAGFGTLHVRALVESPAGELLIGAREGLYRAAWAAGSIERLDSSPVRSIALGDGGVLLAAGEEGLRRIDGRRVTLAATPDPWIEWVGLAGTEVTVLSAMGLARGPLGGTLTPVPGGQDASSAALAEGRLFAVSGPSLLRFDPGGTVSEERVPSAPRRVFACRGELFADTDAGLYRRAKDGWTLARSRPASLPPGSPHVNALAWLNSRLVVGLFDGGLLVGDLSGAAPDWRPVPGSSAWGVNALLPAGGALYVASLRGAARFDGERLIPIDAAGAGAAFSLAATRDGVAIGFAQGVLLPGARLLSAFHGLPGNQALALLQADALYVGTPSGLGAIVGSRVAWRVAAGDGQLPNPWVTTLAEFGGALYIGTYGGGVTRRRARPDGPASGVFDAFVETEGFKINPGCLVQARGRLYLGTDGHGLFRLTADGRRFEPVRVALPSPHVTALAAGPDGLIVGTDEGIARLRLSSDSEDS